MCTFFLLLLLFYSCTISYFDFSVRYTHPLTPLYTAHVPTHVHFQIIKKGIICTRFGISARNRWIIIKKCRKTKHSQNKKKNTAITKATSILLFFCYEKNTFFSVKHAFQRHHFVLQASTRWVWLNVMCVCTECRVRAVQSISELKFH